MNFKSRFNQIVNDYLKMGHDIEVCQRCAISDIQNEVSHNFKIYPFVNNKSDPPTGQILTRSNTHYFLIKSLT